VIPGFKSGGHKKGREFDPRPLDNCKAIQEQQTRHQYSTGWRTKQA